MDPQQGKADIAPDPNTRISMEEYLDLAMNLNDMSMKSFLMDKINLFSRPGLREYMRRPALEIASASDEEIRQFLQTFGKVTGKCNSSAGKGFRIYTDSACTDNRQHLFRQQHLFGQRSGHGRADPFRRR